MFFKYLFQIGQKLRNPSLSKQLEFLKQSESWSKDQLESYQLSKLKLLIEVAENRSSFYQNLYQNIDIKEIKELSDLKKLPIVTKQDLIKFNKEIHTNLSSKKTFQANTSGTSGESLKFIREESADSFNRASIFRGYSWYSVKPWEKNGYFWGFNFSKSERIKTRCLDFLQNRFRVFTLEKNELQSFYKKLQKATYLHGYSSMIYEVAKYINAKQLPPLSNLKMIKGTSEKIYDSYQEEVQKAFGSKISSEYGAAETGIIAFECPKGNMHINMEGVIVEEINNEIIVTNLQMHSFPIIRYKLGDYIKLGDSLNCECGMKHPILKEITGRIGDIVYGVQSEYPSLYLYYIFKNISNQSKLDLVYQAKQVKKGSLLVLIEQNLENGQLEIILKEFYNYFKEDMRIDLKSNSKIVAKGKKLKSFISTL